MCDQEYKAGVVYLDNAATTRMAEEQFQAQELAIQDNGRWRLTPRGFLMSNAILVELLEAQEQSTPLAKGRS